MQNLQQTIEMNRKADELVAQHNSAAYAASPVCWSCEQKIMTPEKAHGNPAMCTSCSYSETYDDSITDLENRIGR
jgi:hypothetical protein